MVALTNLPYSFLPQQGFVNNLDGSLSLLRDGLKERDRQTTQLSEQQIKTSVDQAMNRINLGKDKRDREKTLQAYLSKYTELITMNIRNFKDFDKDLQVFCDYLDKLIKPISKAAEQHIKTINQFIDKGDSLFSNESSRHIKPAQLKLAQLKLAQKFIKLFTQAIFLVPLQKKPFFWRELFFSIVGNRNFRDRNEDIVTDKKGQAIKYPNPNFFVDKRLLVFDSKQSHKLAKPQLEEVISFLSGKIEQAPDALVDLLNRHIDKIGWHEISKSMYYTLTLIEVNGQKKLIMSSNSDAPAPIFIRGLVRDCAEGIAYKYIDELEAQGKEVKFISQALTRIFPSTQINAGEKAREWLPRRICPCPDCRIKGFQRHMSKNPDAFFFTINVTPIIDFIDRQGGILMKSEEAIKSQTNKKFRDGNALAIRRYKARSLYTELGECRLVPDDTGAAVKKTALKKRVTPIN